MSYTSITTAEIAASQPVTQDLFTKVKNDLDDHETRLATAESNNGVLNPITFDLIGNISPDAIRDGILNYRVANNLTLLACRLFVITAGTSGTLSVDVEYKRGAGSWTTILTDAITSDDTDGDLFSTAGTLAVTSLQAGDLLRLNIDSIQGEQRDFSVILEVQGA